MRSRSIPPAAALASVLGTAMALVLAPTIARAHEPLWGETPTIFGPGVYHAEFRFGFVRRNAHPEPGDESTEDFDQEYGLQYGINRFVNVRLRIPVMHSTFGLNTAGDIQETPVNGLGDAILDAKYRFHLRQETGFQRSQALVLGWKIPTGDDHHEAPDGSRLSPSDQPGSGRHGVELGWAGDIEHLTDSTWASVFYGHELGGGFSRGDTIRVDVAYGRWVARPNTAGDLGVNLAFGLHGEGARSDRLEDGSSAENSYSLAGFQVTPIVTKGRAQCRLGVFVPLARGGDEHMTEFPYEVRAGWEMFF